jgi:hypothetical protein
MRRRQRRGGVGRGRVGVGGGRPLSLSACRSPKLARPALSALVAAAAAAAARAASSGPVPLACAGALEVRVDGAPQAWQVVTFASASSSVAAAGAAVSLGYNARAYVVSACPAGGGNFSAGLFATRLPMLGHAWSFDVDLSTAGCGCNAAFYAVAMPGVAPDGSPAPGSSGDFYCDANKVSGVWCTEMDLMEANTAAFAATPHACDAPDAAGFVPKCDGGGCSLNTKTNATLLGPGAGFLVDTTRPFSVSTSFPLDAGGALAAVDTLVSQGGASFHLTRPAGAARTGPTRSRPASRAAWCPRCRCGATRQAVMT